MNWDALCYVRYCSYAKSDTRWHIRNPVLDGSSTGSDVNVATFFAFRGAWVDRFVPTFFIFGHRATNVALPFPMLVAHELPPFAATFLALHLLTWHNIPVGITQEGPVKENYFINLMATKILKTHIPAPWFPFLEWLNTAMPPWSMTIFLSCSLHFDSHPSSFNIWYVKILYHNLVHKSDFCPKWNWCVAIFFPLVKTNLVSINFYWFSCPSPRPTFFLVSHLFSPKHFFPWRSQRRAFVANSLTLFNAYQKRVCPFSTDRKLKYQNI